MRPQTLKKSGTVSESWYSGTQLFCKLVMVNECLHMDWIWKISRGRTYLIMACGLDIIYSRVYIDSHINILNVQAVIILGQNYSEIRHRGTWNHIGLYLEAIGGINHKIFIRNVKYFLQAACYICTLGVKYYGQTCGKKTFTIVIHQSSWIPINPTKL